jgi:hypothetical protein
MDRERAPAGEGVVEALDVASTAVVHHVAGDVPERRGEAVTRLGQDDDVLGNLHGAPCGGRLGACEWMQWAVGVRAVKDQVCRPAQSMTK